MSQQPLQSYPAAPGQYPPPGVGGYVQQPQVPQFMTVQLSVPPEEPRCCCCGARNGLIIWLVLVMALNLLMLILGVTNPNMSTALAVSSSLIQILGCAYPTWALVKGQVEHLRKSAYWYMGAYGISVILMIVDVIVVTNKAADDIITGSPEYSSPAVREAARQFIIMQIAANIIISGLWMALIVNRIFAVRTYLIAMAGYVNNPVQPNVVVHQGLPGQAVYAQPVPYGKQ